MQHARYWTATTSALYERIASRGATVVVFGVGLPTDLSGVGRGRVATVGIGDDDILADEWNVIFCSPKQRWGFVSRDAAAGLPGARSGVRVPPAETDVPEGQRLFEWADLSDLVWLERAAAVLLTRVPSLAVAVPWLRH